MTPAEAACIYHARGWVPIQFERHRKFPFDNEWQKTRHDDVDPRTFNGGNVGIITGEPSGGLMDVDIDCSEALLLADEFLPPTGMEHGRQSKPRSHRWYLAAGAVPRTMQLKDADAGTIVELRAGAGSHQTMVPPSWHHDAKEDVRWETPKLEPATLAGADLRTAVRHLAAASLLLRAYPRGSGGRHNLVFAIAGTLLRGGWNEDDTRDFIGKIARAAGDEEVRDREAAVANSAGRIASDGPAKGLPALAEIVGEKHAAKIVDWLDLRRGKRERKEKDGPRRATLSEIVAAIGADILEGHALRLNEMTGNVEHGGRPISDVWLAALRTKLEETAQLLAGKEDTHDAVALVAHRNPHHPVREYLNGLIWDCRSRLEDFRRALGAEDTPLVRAILKCWLISAVARASAPGCKVDTMPVLVGPQGRRKSTAVRILAGDWFNDTTISIGTKDALTLLRQAWIHEWAELDTLRRARDLEAVKAFIVSQSDIYRPSYGRLDVRVPRSSIFVGTTNSKEFLGDDTGNRRFWPITVGQIDTAALASMRDQLWAEAVALFRAGERWYLADEREQELRVVHKEHRIRDAWEGPIAAHLSRMMYGDVTTADVLEHALAKPTGQWSSGDARRVAVVMRELGWRQTRSGSGPRVWSRAPDDAPDGPDSSGATADSSGTRASGGAGNGGFAPDEPDCSRCAPDENRSSGANEVGATPGGFGAAPDAPDDRFTFVSKDKKGLGDVGMGGNGHPRADHADSSGASGASPFLTDIDADAQWRTAQDEPDQPEGPAAQAVESAPALNMEEW